MNRTHTVYGLAALMAIAVASPADAQAPTARFVGSWKLNPAQSKAAPGESMPATLLTRIDRVDTAHVHWSVTTTDSQGQNDTQTFDTPGNGEFYSLDGDTMVAHTLSATTLQSTFKHVSGQTDTISCTLSAMANQMTCNGLITHQDGSTVRYVDVFDRAP